MTKGLTKSRFVVLCWTRHRDNSKGKGRETNCTLLWWRWRRGEGQCGGGWSVEQGFPNCERWVLYVALSALHLQPLRPRPPFAP